ncbi:MAG: hypothetical protein DWB48_06695 [Nitrosomonas sp.]|nr:hypothetical protein [Nitrosomonas sp.]MDL1865434.1 hypothetical protein [Betaproteobacteria bacterium PRO5]
MNIKLESSVLQVNSSLWALISPLMIWGLHFLFCYIFTAIHCAKNGPFMTLNDAQLAIGVATVVALLLVTVLGCIAWTQLHIKDDLLLHERSTNEDRAHFLAVATLLLACLGFVAIVFTAIPAFIFEDCR